jgi:Asp/Glu/hydantoin racemase
MPKRLAVLHTSFVFINVEPVFKDLFKELLPEVGIVDFVDSDVLAAVNRDGGINQSHIRRMVHLAQAAEDAGVDLIFSACSSLGPSIDVARKMVHTPIIKIDDAMTQRAVELGSTIGVMATVPTTLPPTLELLNQQSQAQNKPIVTKTHLVEGAWSVLMGGDRARYDRMVADGAQALAPQVDLIVLAQASMSRLAPMLSSETGKQVLSSPRLAVEYVRSLLENLGTK